MKNKKYEPATELLPLNFEDVGNGMYADGYEEYAVEDFNELRADANWHLSKLFVNNILKIDDYDDVDIVDAVNDLLYSDKSFEQIEKIIRKQFNIN